MVGRKSRAKADETQNRVVWQPLTKLLRERLYDGACLLQTSRQYGPKGKYKSPNDELSFWNFAAGLSAHAIAYSKTH
jgi:hypothetical protein